MVTGGTVKPHVFYEDMGIYAPTGPGGRFFVKLRGRNIPETLQAIDHLWDGIGGSGEAIRRQFMAQELERNYRTLRQESKLVAALAGVAMFIAALGLFGLSAFAAERRTKEIGVRKAMGASRADILRLLFWDFSKPVLWANLLAWPAAWFFIRHWLEGYAYHIEVSVWIFLGASALAVVVAVVTVSGHAILIARAEPVTALRYE
jgi:putative ABC transport system permease protein